MTKKKTKSKKNQVLSEQKLRSIRTQNRIRSTLTGTRTFDRSLHKTNIWLKDIMDLMEWDNRERALSLLRATLHGLRDILPTSEVLHLGAQLPILVRGVYYDCWRHQSEPLRLKTLTEFYELVGEHLGPARFKFSNDELSKGVGVAIYTLSKHIDIGEVRDIKMLLKKGLKDLIPVSLDKQKQGRRGQAVPPGSRATLRKAAAQVAAAKENQRFRNALHNR